MERERIEIHVRDTYTSEDRMALSGGEQDPSHVDDFHLHWRPKDRHVVLLVDGSMVSHVGLVRHTIRVAERAVEVAGFGGVLTHPDHQGRGFGRVAMQKAEAYAHGVLGVDFGYLFCRQAMQPWYERLGWQRVEQPVWIDQPQGIMQAPLPSMVNCLGQEPWPPGEIQLGSYPW